VNALELVTRISRLRPGASAEDVLRWALLIAVHSPASAPSDRGDWNRVCESAFGSDSGLEDQLFALTAELTAKADQHAAMTDEIQNLAATRPCEFQPEHVWMLVRALRVQSQILDLYLGTAPASPVTGAQ
jgi:hypothetical protein